MTDWSVENPVRIDKWLWAARFFKTRALAARAVGGGLVQVNGERVKPSRLIKIGDRLRINRQLEVFAVLVLGLAERRGPATLARQLYEESEESRRARLEGREERRLRATDPGILVARRPNKRDRRLIRRFVRGDDD